MKIAPAIYQIFLCGTLLFGALATRVETAESYGYQLAMIDARAGDPKAVLMKKKITPKSAAVREFEWILETLRNRCQNPTDVIVRDLVESWRFVQRRGHTVTLLEFSRQASDLSNFAFQAMHNKKMDFNKVLVKLLKDKYKIKL